MTLAAAIADWITAITVIVGIVIAVVELRNARKDREDRAAFEMVHALMTPEWMRSIVRVQAIDETMAPERLEDDPRLMEAAHSVGIMLEAMGYAVYRRIVPLEVVQELVGGAVRVAWRRLGPYVQFERARSGSQKSWEWFQWLAERLETHQGPTSLERGAHEAFRDWRPS